MTPEQAALVAKAERSIAAARMLAGAGHHEFAVSRAYYAMFYLAEALLLSEGLAFSKHSAVISGLGSHFVKTGRLGPEYHAYLRDAHDLRNLGDYDTGAEIDPQESGRQIVRAEAFLETTRQLLEDAHA